MKKIITYSLGLLSLIAISAQGVQAQSCDTLRNYNPADDFYQFTSGVDFPFGQDTITDNLGDIYELNYWSEPYNVTAATEVRAVRFAPWKVDDIGDVDSIAFYVWGDDAGVPDLTNELGKEWIRYDEMTANQYNLLEFTTPAPVNGNFHVGYEVNYDAQEDTFALLATQPASTNYTQFQLHALGTGGGDNAWLDIPTVYGSNTAFVLDVLTSNATAPTADFTFTPASGVVCLGSDFQLDGSASTGTVDVYDWLLTNANASTVYDTDSGVNGTLTPTTSPSQQLLVLFTDGACTTDFEFVAVNVLDPVDATVTPTDLTCGNTNGEIEITGATGGDGTYTYEITDGGGNTTTEASGVFSSLTAGTYDVVVYTAGGGCEYTETVTLSTIAPETVTAGADETICEGDAVSLTATGTGTIEWFDGSGNSVGTGASLSVTPTASQTYEAVLTDANGCTDADQLQVTVNPVNDASFSYTSNTLCTGGANETPTINGTGTFTSTPTGLNFVDASTGEIDMTTSTDGTYDVTFTTTGACGEVETQSITITSTPDATYSYSNAEFCAEVGTESPTFPTGASSGTFSSTPAGLDVNTSNGTITLETSTPGTYTVTNTIAASGSCPADGHDETVTINALPTVDGGADQEVCEGEDVTLTATTSAGNISWDNGVTDGTAFTATATTTYTVTADDIGCTSTDEVLVTVNELPTVDAGTDETACTNHDPIALTGTPTGGTFSGTSVNGNEFDPSVGAGTYTVTYTYTDGNGCEASDDLTITVDGCASIDENSIGEGITIMPNPATDYIDVVIEGENTINSIHVLSAEGRVVELNTSTLNANTTRIDVSAAAKGTYFIQLNTSNGQITRKVILQ